jgi:hypothetical protein
VVKAGEQQAVQAGEQIVLLEISKTDDFSWMKAAEPLLETIRGLTQAISKQMPASNNQEKDKYHRRKNPKAPKGLKTAFLNFCDDKRHEVHESLGANLRATEYAKEFCCMRRDGGATCAISKCK